MRKTFEKEDVFSQIVLNDQAFLKKGAASGTNAMLEGLPYLAELEKERIRRSTPVLMKVGQSERWQNGRTRELTTALVSLGLSNPVELPTGGDALGIVPVAALIVPAVQKDEIEKAVRDECSRLGGDAVTANRDSTLHPRAAAGYLVYHAKAPTWVWTLVEPSFRSQRRDEKMGKGR